MNYPALLNELKQEYSFGFFNGLQILFKLNFDFVYSLKGFNHFLKLPGLVGCLVQIIKDT